MNRAERRKQEKAGVSQHYIISQIRREEFERGHKQGTKDCYKAVIGIVMWVAMMEFGLGQQRLTKFFQRVLENIDCFNTGNLTSSDFDVIMSELAKKGVHINDIDKGENRKWK